MAISTGNGIRPQGNERVRKQTSTGEDIDNVLGATVPGFVISTGAKILKGEGPVEAASNTFSEARQGFQSLRRKLGNWLAGQ